MRALSVPRALLFVLSGIVAVVALSFSAEHAQAYCRETVDTPSSGPCVEKPGSPRLVWARPCMTYVFEENLFSRLSLFDEASIREVFQTSYDTWASVDCGGSEPFLAQQAEATTTTDASEFVFDVPNESIVVARTRSEWSELGRSRNALALTLLWHDVDTGEILDVDMELNTGAGRFANCDQPCGRDMMDLENTITHEAGHVLGLGHSTVMDSTMEEAASDGETKKRSLEPDDMAGYCSLNLPSPACDAGECACEPARVFPSQRSTTTCGCHVLGARQATGGAVTRETGVFAFGLVAFLLVATATRAEARRARRAEKRATRTPDVSRPDQT